LGKTIAILEMTFPTLEAYNEIPGCFMIAGILRNQEAYTIFFTVTEKVFKTNRN